jgi:hypothetical protein
MLVIVV